MEQMTLRELVAEAAVALSSAGLEQSSGRVSDVPTVRTIRYYARHGLLSAPSGWRGRAALYGRHHVAEIVAIKRLQSSGLTLDEVQRRMAGLDEDAVFALAGLAPAAPVEQAAEERPRGRFWLSEPEPLIEQDEELELRAQAAQAELLERVMTGARLDAHAVLWIEGASRALDDDDVAAIEAAAQPLLRLLRARRILE